jgi:hypothetical protein
MLMNNVNMIKGLISSVLMSALDQINKVQALIKAVETSGMYTIVLSPSKGSWSNRLRMAPGAPPEDNFHCSTGMCAIMCAPNLDKAMKDFVDTVEKLKKGTTTWDPTRVKNKPSKKVDPPVRPKAIMDEWRSLTIADLFPSLSDLLGAVSSQVMGFIDDIKHAMDNISNILSSVASALNGMNDIMDQLNATGAYACMLGPGSGGLVTRLTAESGAPSQSTQLYTVGFCVGMLTPNLGQCDEAYATLCNIFEPDLGKYEPFTPTFIFPTIKSWASPMEGYYEKFVYVSLFANLEGATIYYTVNGQDPRENPAALIFDPAYPIYVDKNNTVIKYYAERGLALERRTRISTYKIITFIGDSPYSPTYGVLPVENFTVPPIKEWGSVETCITSGTSALTIPGDAGNSELDITGKLLLDVLPKRAPIDMIPVDEIIVDTKIKYTDIEPGYRNLQDDLNNMALDAEARNLQQAAIKLVKYGQAPWGNNGFTDQSAYWIWNESGAAVSALVSKLILFETVFENKTNNNLDLLLYYMADNTASCYINNRFVDTDTGWYVSGADNLGSWEILNGYRTVPFSVLAGSRCTIDWIATNWGGRAGLVFSIMNTNTSLPIAERILLNSGTAQVFTSPTVITKLDRG